MAGSAPNPATDLNLLYGMLALQMGFVTRDALLAGMRAWVFAKERSLGELLQEQQALTPQQRQVLDAVVQEHPKAHGGDTQRSLNSAARPAALPTDLHQSALGLILLVPQGVVEIEDILIEGAVAGRDTHIGTGSTGLRPIGVLGARGATRQE